MENPDDIERQLIALEIKSSYAEDLIDQLNTTVFRQQQPIKRLLREVTELRRQLPEDPIPVLPNLRDALSPHY